MVEIQNVSYGYLKGQNVIKDFSVKFSEGGIYGLLGKNGTGKSTLLYLIMGLLHARQGQILFNGIETRFKSLVGSHSAVVSRASPPITLLTSVDCVR